jgi:hypothetical protein
MSQKLGRNDPCWCGLGKKYKHCHLMSDKQSGPRPDEVMKAIMGPLGKKLCLHPEAGPDTCSGKIIQAHTVPRASGLRHIAKDGHVYALRVDAFARQPITEATLIGMNRASTFTGFCSKHDNDTFAPIDNHAFTTDPQHVFLLAYRAMCLALFGIQARNKSNQNQSTLIQRLPPELQPGFRTLLERTGTGTSLGLRDAEHHKRIFDDALTNSDFSSLKYYAVEFDHSPEILLSFAHYPSANFNGERLQDLRSNKTLDMITVSLVTTENGIAAVFAWMGNSKANTALTNSLDALPDSEIAAAIVRYAFEFSDNVYCKPSWWDSLDGPLKASLQERTTKAAQLDQPRRRDCLVDDGLRPVSWPVIARHKKI